MQTNYEELILGVVTEGLNDISEERKEKLSKRLPASVELLEEPQKTVVKSLFGIDQESHENIFEVAKKIGVADREVTKILAQALRELQTKITNI